MTRREHYQEAEALLDRSAELFAEGHSDSVIVASTLVMAAQAHAILATIDVGFDWETA